MPTANGSKRKQTPLLIAVVLVVGLAAMTFGIWRTAREFGTAGPAPAGLRVSMGTSATVLSEPMPVPSFALVDHQGRPFTQDNLRGRWTFLFFGYIYCPDVCPTTLMILNQVDRQLQNTTSELRPAFVFISVDPARDTVEKLADYVSYFNPDFLGATGPEEALQALTKPLGIGYRRRAAEGLPDDKYFVDHTASILLINPQGQLRALSSPPHDAATIARDYQKIVAQGG